MGKNSAFEIYKHVYHNYKNLISRYSDKVKIEQNKTKYNYSSEFWIEDYSKLKDQLSKEKHKSINHMVNRSNQNLGG